MSQTLCHSSNIGVPSKSVTKNEATDALTLTWESSAAGKSTVAGVSIPASESRSTESLTKKSHSVENHFIETGFINRPAALCRPGVELGPAHARDAGERCGRETRIRNADKRHGERTRRPRMQRAVA